MYLGNLEARRDWGYAPEHVDLMWPHAPGRRAGRLRARYRRGPQRAGLCETTFGLVDLDWRDHVEVDRRDLWPKDVSLLVGDASRARERFGWEPEVRLRQLVQIMVQADLAAEGLDPADHLRSSPPISRPE